MNTTTKPAVTDILPLNEQPSCGGLQCPRAANILHNNAMPFHIYNTIILPENQRKKHAIRICHNYFFFLHLPLQHHEHTPGTAHLTHCRFCRRTLHPALTATPTGLSYSCWSSSYSSQTCSLWTSWLLCSGKSDSTKHQDKGCKALSGCPCLVPHCWLFLLEYTCNFPNEYYLGIDRQNPVIR